MANEIAVGLAALTETLRQQNEDAGKRHEELVKAVKKDKENGDNGNGDNGNGGNGGNDDNGGNGTGNEPSRVRERFDKLTNAIKNPPWVSKFGKTIGRQFTKSLKATGLSGGVDFLKGGIKGILLGSLLLGFIAFINSPFFDVFLQAIRDDILPGIANLIEWFKKNMPTIKKAIGVIIDGFVAAKDAVVALYDLFFGEEGFTFDKLKKVIKENGLALAALVGVGGYLAPGLFLKPLITGFKILGATLGILGLRLSNFRAPPVPGAPGAGAGAGAGAIPPRQAAADNRQRLSQMSERRFQRIQQQNPNLRITRTGGVCGTVSIDRVGGGFASDADVANLRGRGLAAARSGRLRDLGARFPRMGGLLRGIGRLVPGLGAVLAGYEAYSILMSDRPAEEKAKAISGLIGAATMSLILGKIGAAGGFFVGGPFGALGGGIIGAAAGFFGGQYMGEKLFEFLLGGNVSENELIPPRPKVTASGHRGRSQRRRQREYDEKFGTSDENPIPKRMSQPSPETPNANLGPEEVSADQTETGMKIKEISRSVEMMRNELLRTPQVTPPSVNNIDASTNSNTSNTNINSTSVQNQNYALRNYAALGGAGL